MKKILAFISVAAMMCSFSACGTQTQNNGSSNTGVANSNEASNQTNESSTTSSDSSQASNSSKSKDLVKTLGDGSTLEVKGDTVTITKPVNDKLKHIYKFGFSDNKLTSDEIRIDASGDEVKNLKGIAEYFEAYGYKVKEKTTNSVTLYSKDLTNFNKEYPTKDDFVNDVIKKDRYYFDDEGE